MGQNQSGPDIFSTCCTDAEERRFATESRRTPKKEDPSENRLLRPPHASPVGFTAVSPGHFVSTSVKLQNRPPASSSPASSVSPPTKASTPGGRHSAPPSSPQETSPSSQGTASHGTSPPSAKPEKSQNGNDLTGIAETTKDPWSGRAHVETQKALRTQGFNSNKVIICLKCDGYSPYNALQCENCLNPLEMDRKALEKNEAKKRKAALAEKSTR